MFIFYSDNLNAEDTPQANAKDSVPQSDAPDLPHVSGLADGDAEKDIENHAEDTRELAPGPLSKEARNEAQKLGDFVVEESQRIALKFKKSRREIMLAAGLSTRGGRGANSFNMFKKWYAHHNPKRETTS